MENVYMKQELLKYKENFDYYYLVAPGSDYGKVMWQDISLLNNGSVLQQPIKQCNKLIEVLHHLHFSFGINQYIHLPFQNIWKNQYSINEIDFDSNKKYCIIFTDVSAGRTDAIYLKSLSQHKNITLILILVNRMSKRKKILKDRLQFFQQIYSFDYRDAIQNDFIFYPTNYSKVDLNVHSLKSDLFFVGMSKGRTDMLNDVYKLVETNGGKADFYISGAKKREKKYEGIHYNKWLDYSEVLQHIASSNCILEIMEKNQEGVTLRMMEAVCYNKRLLTNNQNIKESVFYKSGYIYVFENIEDIDISFVMDKRPVDYHYNNEFSPIHFIDYINKITGERKDL